MRDGSNRGDKSFLWKGGLILLPVFVLAVAGFMSLRKDKAIARQEATNRAEAAANSLLLRFWGNFANGLLPASSQTNSVLVDGHGKLVEPAPSREVPEPRVLDVSALTEEQRQLWNKIQALTSDRVDAEGALEPLNKFIETEPPAEFKANASYVVALRLANGGAVEHAFSTLEDLLRFHPDAEGETGVPLAPLAMIKWLEWSKKSANGVDVPSWALEQTCSNLVVRPSALTSMLLDRIRSLASGENDGIISQWQQRWEADERLRLLYKLSSLKLQESLGTTRRIGASEAASSTAMLSLQKQAIDLKPAPVITWFWFSQTEEPSGVAVSNWFAWLSKTGTNTLRATCVEESAIGAMLTELVESEQLPNYFSASAEVAGKIVRKSAPDLRLQKESPYMTRSGGGLRSEPVEAPAAQVLAKASHSEGQGEIASVSILLTRPETLYRAQRARTVWFGLLIAAAAAAAVAGWFASYRAFRRQAQLSELKSNFVSSVSHELRAPIASVRLMSESLASGKVTGEQRRNEYFRLISQECGRLSTLVENVLDFSRIEQGRKSYEFEPTDPVALAATTVQTLEPYARDKGVKLELGTGDGVRSEPVWDGKAVQQALVNLIDNAVKHSPKNGAVVVGLDTVEQSVALWVEDCGPGIPPEEHERIFERFYRRGSELRRETGGVGIGLSIVKHIVESHGGKVTVRSAPGQGSRFTMVLPIVPPDSAQAKIMS